MRGSPDTCVKAVRCKCRLGDKESLAWWGIRVCLLEVCCSLSRFSSHCNISLCEIRSIPGLLHEHCLPAGDELCRHSDRALELYVAHHALYTRDLDIVVQFSGSP